jgi:hypothetical protein
MPRRDSNGCLREAARMRRPQCGVERCASREPPKWLHPGARIVSRSFRQPATFAGFAQLVLHCVFELVRQPIGYLLLAAVFQIKKFLVTVTCSAGPQQYVGVFVR